MKKLLLFVLPALVSLHAYSQETAEEMEVSVKAPSMKELINKVWNKLPTDCLCPSWVNRQTDDEVCAGIALKHFRHIITRCDVSKGMKEAIKIEFKIIKLIPVGKAAGAVLDIADMTAKALTAETPEQLTTDLQTYAAGKFGVDQLVGKLKSFLPEGTAGDVLGNLTKAFMKEVMKKAKEAIMPSEQSYECQPEAICKDNIHMNFTPVEEPEEGSRVIGYFNYSGSGDCECQLGCSESTPQPKMKTWSVHGRIALEISNAQVVEKGAWFWKKKVLELTLTPSDPGFTVMADCDCSTSASDSSGVAWDQEDKYAHLFIGGGLILEDATKRFGLYGVNAAYTHPVSQQVGITGDAGFYFGSQDMTKYRRFQFLAGPSLLLPQKGKAGFTPHLLAGIASTGSSFEGNSEKYSSSCFSVAAGTNINIRLTPKTSMAVRVDYNPAFARGGTAHNFRLGVGIVL